MSHFCNIKNKESAGKGYYFKMLMASSIKLTSGGFSQGNVSTQANLYPNALDNVSLYHKIYKRRLHIVNQLSSLAVFGFRLNISVFGF